MSTFTAIEVDKLPAPDIFEQRTFEDIYAERLAEFRSACPEYTAIVESDPVVKLLQTSAYREMTLREQFNQRARGLLLPYSQKADLDNLAVPYGVQRKLIVAADPDTGTAAVYENDEDFRRRIQLAPEGLSVAGPEGAYIFHSLSSHTDVLDASVTGPKPEDITAIVLRVLVEQGAAAAVVDAVADALRQVVWPGTVIVSVLSRVGDGAPSPSLLAAVEAALLNDDVRPLTDHVIVAPALVHPYEIRAKLTTFNGPDSDLVIAEANRRVRLFLSQSQRLGRDVPLSALYAALHVEGVQRVQLDSPTADLIVNSQSAAFCTGVYIESAGTND